MRVFVTGASGYIGNAVAMAFRQAGHRVVGLVRSDLDIKKLQLFEIEALKGSLEEFENYQSVLEWAEVIVHCAFDFKLESQVLETILKVGSRSVLPKAFIYTSGVWVYGSSNTEVFDEASVPRPLDLVKWRLPLEKKILDASTPTFKTVVIRPGVVYGLGGSLTNLWMETALEGQVQMVGEGANHWPMVHVNDLAWGYVLAAEKEINQKVFNLTDGSSYTVFEMASSVAKLTKTPPPISLADPTAKYGALVEGLISDQKVSSERARRLLGWVPRHKSFIDEVSLYAKSVISR